LEAYDTDTNPWGGRHVDEDFASYAQARQQHLYRTAYLLCGDRDRAQDLVQSTLVALLRSWSRARRADNPDAYARQALTRVFLSERRKLRREAELYAKAHGDRSDRAEGGSDLRAMIILRYWEDLSIEETAAILGCSTGNVKSQCSRSLVKLRSQLGERFTDLIIV
jgi:DNA-directed RNA polymerase specialized sigma24 family protein